MEEELSNKRKADWLDESIPETEFAQNIVSFQDYVELMHYVPEKKEPKEEKSAFKKPATRRLVCSEELQGLRNEIKILNCHVRILMQENQKLGLAIKELQGKQVKVIPLSKATPISLY